MKDKNSFPADKNDKQHLLAGFHARGVLPHLKREGGTYFVTFRQAGTLPHEVLERYKREREVILQQAEMARRPLSWHEQEELFRWYSDRVDKYLDAGHGICHLGVAENAAIVAGALQFFEKRRYELCNGGLCSGPEAWPWSSAFVRRPVE